jgi:hypothetical protein
MHVQLWFRDALLCSPFSPTVTIGTISTSSKRFKVATYTAGYWTHPTLLLVSCNTQRYCHATPVVWCLGIFNNFEILLFLCLKFQTNGFEHEDCSIMGLEFILFVFQDLISMDGEESYCFQYIYTLGKNLHFSVSMVSSDMMSYYISHSTSHVRQRCWIL